MLDINLILFFLLYLIVCLAFTVIYTKDSIIAIISLVLIYTLTAILLIIVGCEFLGILLIIVYVGAISILFLFIIIMLNLRVIEERNIIQNYIGVTLVILSNCILVIYLSVDESFWSQYYNLIPLYSEPSKLELLLREGSNIGLLGDVIYNVRSEVVIVSGIILLLSLIGSISIAVSFDLVDLHVQKQKRYKEKRNINEILGKYL